MGVEIERIGRINFLLNEAARLYDLDLRWFQEWPNFFKDPVYREDARKIHSHIMRKHEHPRPSDCMFRVDYSLKEEIRRVDFGIFPEGPLRPKNEKVYSNNPRR